MILDLKNYISHDRKFAKSNDQASFCVTLVSLCDGGPLVMVLLARQAFWDTRNVRISL